MKTSIKVKKIIYTNREFILPYIHTPYSTIQRKEQNKNFSAHENTKNMPKASKMKSPLIPTPELLPGGQVAFFPLLRLKQIRELL